MRAIYEPKGAALEYAPLALNLYLGCEHGCRYCYCPGVMRTSGHRFFQDARPRDILDKVRLDAEDMAKAGDDREVLLSFIGDPYQPRENRMLLTRRAIKHLASNGVRFTVLTKAGMNAIRDFDLLQAAGDQASFGTSLAWWDDWFRQYWEPGAAPVLERIQAIEAAQKRGIRTWVSVEPVIDPVESLQVLANLRNMVDHIKVGKISHDSKLEKAVDWRAFRERAVELLEVGRASYYIKRSLRDSA